MFLKNSQKFIFHRIIPQNYTATNHGYKNTQLKFRNDQTSTFWDNVWNSISTLITLALQPLDLLNFWKRFWQAFICTYNLSWVHLPSPTGKGWKVPSRQRTTTATYNIVRAANTDFDSSICTMVLNENYRELLYYLIFSSQRSSLSMVGIVLVLNLMPIISAIS